MKKTSSRQQGFTLIELVIVIIVLGILSASAIPKFVNLQSDAKKAVLSGLEGAIQDATNMAHYKALISGYSDTVYIIDMPVTNNQTVTIWGGYPHVGRDTGGGIPDEDDIVNILELSGDFTVTRARSSGADTATFSLADNCFVSYTEAIYDNSSGIKSGDSRSVKTSYKIERVDTGC